MTTDTSEKGLETIIMRHMTGVDGFSVAPSLVAENPDLTGLDTSRAVPRTTTGDSHSTCRNCSPSSAPLSMRGSKNWRCPRRMTRRTSTPKISHGLSAEIGRRGVIDVLRKGVDDGPLHFDLFYGTPSPGNTKAEALHAQVRMVHALNWNFHVSIP
jgi:type I restriction enzyme R subunit